MYAYDKKIILNFLPIKTGGGLQNALSFLETLRELPGRRSKFAAVVLEGSSVQKLCKEIEIEHFPVANTGWARFKFEQNVMSFLGTERVCFTFFGPPMIGTCKKWVNVVGCAYSNLFYPEIPFWGYLPFVYRLKAELIDMIRRRGVSRADFWIFETDVLRERAIRICHFPENRVGVVPMTASSLVSPDRVQPVLCANFGSQINAGFRILYLAGPNPNKRIHVLPLIAKELLRAGRRDFVFVISLPQDHWYTRRVMNSFMEQGVGKYVKNIGPIGSHAVASVIASCDAMCTFSVLESFSNNFAEAWRMSKPLVVTEADWSRSSCGKAALYVDPEQVEQTSRALQQLMDDRMLRETLVKEGLKQLDLSPTSGEKTRLYLSYIDNAIRLGSLDPIKRTAIHWPRISRAGRRNEARSV